MSKVELSFDTSDPVQASRFKIAEKSPELFVAIRKFKMYLESHKQNQKVDAHEVLTQLNFELESRGIHLDQLERDETKSM